MMDAETQAKIERVIGYLGAYGLTRLETDPPEDRRADFHTIRITVATGDHRLLQLKGSWLQEKTAQAIVRHLESKNVVYGLQTSFRRISLIAADETEFVAL